MEHQKDPNWPSNQRQHGILSLQTRNTVQCSAQEMTELRGTTVQVTTRPNSDPRAGRLAELGSAGQAVLALQQQHTSRGWVGRQQAAPLLPPQAVLMLTLPLHYQHRTTRGGHCPTCVSSASRLGQLAEKPTAPTCLNLIVLRLLCPEHSALQPRLGLDILGPADEPGLLTQRPEMLIPFTSEMLVITASTGL